MVIQLWLIRALVIVVSALHAIPVQAVDVLVPASPSNDATTVESNFLGASFELSAFDKYCGFDPNSHLAVRNRMLTS